MIDEIRVESIVEFERRNFVLALREKLKGIQPKDIISVQITQSGMSNEIVAYIVYKSHQKITKINHGN